MQFSTEESHGVSKSSQGGGVPSVGKCGGNEVEAFEGVIEL